MKPGNGRQRACDQTDGFRSILSNVYLRPQCLGCGAIVQIDIAQTVTFERESYVLVFHVRRPLRFGKLAWRPNVKKAAKRCQASVTRIFHRIEMVPNEGGMFVGEPLRLLVFPCGNPKNVSRIPPEKIWRNV